MADVDRASSLGKIKNDNVDLTTMELNSMKAQSPHNHNFWVPVTPEKPCENLGNSNATQIRNPMFEEQQIQQWLLDDNIDLNGLSCIQILSLADNLPSAIGLAERPSQFEAVSITAIPDKEEESNEVSSISPNNRKRKGLVDLDKKRSGKRQNKYFWPKIEHGQKPKPQNSRTPTPKTPKSKTPKPKTPKILRKNQGRKEVEGCRGALNFEDNKNVNLDDGVITGVEKQSDGLVNYQESNDKNIEKLYENKKDKSFSVYRRKPEFKLIHECRRVEAHFLHSCKKRTPRIRKPAEQIRSFEDFNYKLVVGNFLDRIVISNGKSQMSFPTKGEFIKEHFKCVWSLLSSLVKVRRKKRSVRRLIPKCVQQLSGYDKDSRLKDLQNGLPVNETPNSGKTAKTITKASKRGDSTHKTKTKVVKEKKPRGPYKGKEKRKDYLSDLKDWDNESLEQIMDTFIEDFKSMILYDNPKKLERWSVMLSEENDNGGAEIPFQDNEKLKEQSALLFHNMYRFLAIMTELQGSKKFEPWNGSVLDSVVGVFLTQNVSDVLSSDAYMNLASRFPLKRTNKTTNKQDEVNCNGHQYIVECPDEVVECPNEVVECPDEVVECRDEVVESTPETTPEDDTEEQSRGKEYEAALNDMMAALPYLLRYYKKGKKGEDAKSEVDWEAIRVQFLGNSTERSPTTQDSVDWDAVRKAPVKQISDAIECRGQHRAIATKIKKLLNRLVKDHKTLDLEWLRNAPPQVAKAYLLKFYGLGLKSVECLRLLTLHHDGFPVDVNIARIAIRLGWVPLKPLPSGLPFHLLEKYPLENEIQQYLWPRMLNFPREFLYQSHYQLISFGKIFCTKKNPNCNACPFKNECKYYKSRVDSIKMKHPFLPWIKSKGKKKKIESLPNPFDLKKCVPASLPNLPSNRSPYLWKQDYTVSQQCEPIIDFPESPIREKECLNDTEEGELGDMEDLLKEEMGDIEDLFKGDDEFIFINLVEKDNVSVSSPSRALVTLSSDAGFNPKQINPERLRTEHQVYELPYDHPLLKDFERQQGDVPYLLAIWTQGQCQKDASTSCCGEACSSCSSERDFDECLTIPGTILLSVRTAMDGFFPLNGTYFQKNEVFADYETSERPLNVPTSWIWNLKKRTLYCGSGTHSIFKGLTLDEIKCCSLEGFICTRGFDRRTRAPKKLPMKFHNRPTAKAKVNEKLEDN